MRVWASGLERGLGGVGARRPSGLCTAQEDGMNVGSHSEVPGCRLGPSRPGARNLQLFRFQLARFGSVIPKCGTLGFLK